MSKTNTLHSRDGSSEQVRKEDITKSDLGKNALSRQDAIRALARAILYLTHTPEEDLDKVSAKHAIGEALGYLEAKPESKQ